MRTAIDLRLNSYRGGGIPQYTNQLLYALADVARADDQFVAIRHRKPAIGSVVYGRTIDTRKVWTPPHHRWEQLILPLELVRLRADVIHFPDFIPLFRMRVPTVITVHDLAFIHYPQILDRNARRYYSQIQRAVERADAVIAVSHSTRNDIVELLKIDPAKIEVIHEAAAPHFKQLELAPQARHTINGHELVANTFALFVGTIEPRKNLQTLLHALHTLRQQGEPPVLVVAGTRGWLDEPVFALVEQLGIAEHVRFIGGVSERDLVWLYNACRVYVHPELYSGFGLPILEAMQCGAPVIAADTSSLPEVAGDAAILLSPTDHQAWAETWQRVWHNNQLRGQLRQRGLQRAAAFTWTAAAQQTLDIYRRVANKSSNRS